MHLILLSVRCLGLTLTKGTAVALQAESLVHFRVAERRLILPDTSLDLAWVDDRIDVIGPMSKARLTRYPIGKRIVLLSLNPLIGSRWLGVPLHLLTDRVVELLDINPLVAKQLAEHFAKGTVSNLVRPNKDGKVRPATRGEVAAAYLSQGESVGRVAEIVNLSERHLTRHFHVTTGLHPKRYQRITRLRQAVTAAKAGVALAEVAASFGFADQAHFNREVRALTGGTPRTILQNVGNVQDIDRPLA